MRAAAASAFSEAHGAGSFAVVVGNRAAKPLNSTAGGQNSDRCRRRYFRSGGDLAHFALLVFDPQRRPRLLRGDRERRQFTDVARIVLDDDGGFEIRRDLLEAIDRSQCRCVVSVECGHTVVFVSIWRSIIRSPKGEKPGDCPCSLPRFVCQPSRPQEPSASTGLRRCSQLPTR